MENEILYSWKFNDKKERSQLWYIITLSIVIWLVIWWFLTKQYWMSFLIMLITWVTYFIENNSEDEVNVNITNLWIKISNTFYDFSKINSFTLIYDWENAVYLRLIINKKWLKVFNIYIDNTIANNLKEILPNFIEENPKWDLSFIEKLINKLKL
jgi:hypothetical protein